MCVFSQRCQRLLHISYVWGKVESVQKTQPKHGHLRCKCNMLQTNMSEQDRFHITPSRLRLRAVSRRAFAGLLPKMPPVPMRSIAREKWWLGDYFSFGKDCFQGAVLFFLGRYLFETTHKISLFGTSAMMFWWNILVQKLISDVERKSGWCSTPPCCSFVCVI